MMLQPPRMTTWPSLVLAGGLFAGTLTGCATFVETTHNRPLRTQVAPVHLGREAAAPFAWDTAAATAAGEPLQTFTAGSDGFRSLVIGSVGGSDPVAVRLTEEVARYLHRNQMIMGGVQTTVLRTLNPHGMKHGGHENAAGLYLNDYFPPVDRELTLAEERRLPREVQFLMGHITDQRPQRIIHIRSVKESAGMLAVSHGAADSGREIAQWLGFKIKSLPEDASSGTFESWVARRGDCDVITVGIPAETQAGDAWPLYGDAVLSLLLDGDSESRRVARERRKQRSARRQDEQTESADEMFREDVPSPVDAAAADSQTEVK